MRRGVRLGFVHNTGSSPFPYSSTRALIVKFADRIGEKLLAKNERHERAGDRGRCGYCAVLTMHGA